MHSTSKEKTAQYQRSFIFGRIVLRFLVMRIKSISTLDKEMRKPS